MLPKSAVRGFSQSLRSARNCFANIKFEINVEIEPGIDSGFDIINPVQISAAGMLPEHLKKEYGEHLVFWGGGVDTQKMLPFGKPKEVREQVLRMCDVFSRDGGFVFNSVHNIQANVPIENIVAMLGAVHEFNK